MKALIHLVPRCGNHSESAFEQRFTELCAELRGAAPTGVRVHAMRRIAMEQAPIGPDTPYQGTLELLGAGGPENFAPLLDGLGEHIEAWCLSDACTLLLGEDHALRPSEQAPIRYQYLMRRNGHFSRQQYLSRYLEVHARFGVECPGIVGYVQFHVDADASRRWAARAALGLWGVDSVSELHIASLELFFAETMTSELGREALADEELFVDRSHSQDFISTMDWQQAPS